MKLRTKMIALVSVLMALMLFMGINGLFSIARTNGHFATTYADRVLPLNQLKIVADMYAVNIVDTTHKANHQSVDFAAAQRLVGEAKRKIEENWKAYMATELTADEKQLASEVTTAMQKADAAVNQLEGLLGAKDAAGLDTFARQTLYKAIDPVSETVSKLVDLQLLEAKKSFEAAQTEYASTRVMTIASLLVALLLAIGVSTWLVVNMSSKIESLRATLRRARDDRDLTLRATVAGDDEIDSIARAYNTLVESMQSLVQTTATAVDTVSREAGNLANTTKEISLASHAGADATSSIAAAVEEVTESMSHIAQNAQAASVLGNSTVQQAESGAKQIRLTVERIQAIDQAVTEAASKVTTLGEDAKRITSVVSVIKEVADQTNLLALNAAIEAARAGEGGRGFAVVADEVRKLAERTAGATVDIQKMVMQIGGNSTEAVGAINATVERAHECATLAEEAGQAIDAISHEAEKENQEIARIADALQEYRAGTQQIANQVERVAEVAEENSAAVSAMNDTAKALSGMTERLQREINAFRYASR